MLKLWKCCRLAKILTWKKKRNRRFTPHLLSLAPMSFRTAKLRTKPYKTNFSPLAFLAGAHLTLVSAIVPPCHQPSRKSPSVHTSNPSPHSLAHAHPPKRRPLYGLASPYSIYPNAHLHTWPAHLNLSLPRLSLPIPLAVPPTEHSASSKEAAPMIVRPIPGSRFRATTRIASWGRSWWLIFLGVFMLVVRML